MPLGVYFGKVVVDSAERVIVVEQIRITGDLLPERYQRCSLLSEFFFS